MGNHPADNIKPLCGKKGVIYISDLIYRNGKMEGSGELISLEDYNKKYDIKK